MNDEFINSVSAQLLTATREQCYRFLEFDWFQQNDLLMEMLLKKKLPDAEFVLKTIANSKFYRKENIIYYIYRHLIDDVSALASLIPEEDFLDVASYHFIVTRTDKRNRVVINLLRNGHKNLASKLIERQKYDTLSMLEYAEEVSLAEDILCLSFPVKNRTRIQYISQYASCPWTLKELEHHFIVLLTTILYDLDLPPYVLVHIFCVGYPFFKQKFGRMSKLVCNVIDSIKRAKSNQESNKTRHSLYLPERDGSARKY